MSRRTRLLVFAIAFFGILALCLIPSNRPSSTVRTLVDAPAAPPISVVTTTSSTSTTTTTTTTAPPETTTTTSPPPPPPPPTTEAPAPVEEAPPAPEPPAPVTEAYSSMEPCGGDLPPCYVKKRESGGNYEALNRSSGASGAWQFLDSTWHGYGGFSKAMYAPPSVQDEKARELWNGGAGCSHWAAC